MRKFIILSFVFAFAVSSQAQNFIRGSVKKGATPNKVDILLKANYASGVGEYLQYVQFSLSIPAAMYQGGVTATMVPSGNMTGTSFVQDAQYTDVTTNERVFTWVCINNGAVTSMSWAANTEFTIGTVTFNHGTNNTQVKMCDFTNTGGGGNFNTYYSAVTNSSGDVTDYSNFFFDDSPTFLVSQKGTYVNGDQYVRTVPLISLPVEMLNFSGYRSGARNILNWKTAFEQNNQGFEVQRSLDGVNYSSLGFVNSLAPSGNSSDVLSYTFADNNVLGAKQYYRLKQVDLNGASKLSNVVVIRGEKPLELTVDGLYPNPASSVVNVLIGAPSKDRVTLVLNDMAGRVVQQQVVNVDAGTNSVQFNVQSLTSGTYLVRLYGASGAEAATGKFVKQ